MARKGQPINVDAPATQPPRVPGPSAKPSAEPPGPSPKPSVEAPPPPKARRQPVPTALKAIGGLVVVAVVFIVAAILGGSSEDGNSIPGAAPAGEPPPAERKPSSEQPPSELGYPDFATNNTTRVGGADPASNAAAVALAVYPSGDEAEKPAAVTIVDASDWEGALAAAVLMAQPLQAPVLISEADGLPDPTSEALDELDPQGNRSGGGVQAYAIGGAATPGGLETRRIRATGVAAAAAIANLRDKALDGPPRHIVVAPTAAPAFAMPAAAWAARSGDPVLFANTDELPRPTRAVLNRHPDTPVYVLGPSSTISSEVVRQIRKIGNRVSRVSGEDPVTNAIALARYDDGDFGWNVNDPGHGFVVARSDSVLDAAASSALSASGTWGPLLLTDSADTLPAAVRDYLLDVKPGYTTDPTRAFYNHVWVIGDEDAIDVSQQAEIDELAELAKIGGEP